MLLSRSCHPFLCRLLQCIITRYLFIIIIIIFCLSIVFRKAQVYQWLCVANDNSFITIQTSHPHTRKKKQGGWKKRTHNPTNRWLSFKFFIIKPKMCHHDHQGSFFVCVFVSLFNTLHLFASLLSLSRFHVCRCVSNWCNNVNKRLEGASSSSFSSIKQEFFPFSRVKMSQNLQNSFKKDVTSQQKSLHIDVCDTFWFERRKIQNENLCLMFLAFT